MGRINGERVALAAVLDWPYAAKRAALRLYVDLLRRAEQAGHVSFTASQRHLADTAGFGFSDKSPGGHLSRKSVRDALTDLSNMGYVNVARTPLAHDESSRMHAQTQVWLQTEGPPWEVSPAVHDESHYLYMPCVEALMGSNVQSEAGSLFNVFQHVVFEEGPGLGINALRVLVSLHAVGPMSASQLAERLQLSPRTAHNKLRDLAEYRLVESVRGLWAAQVRSLDEVAEELGIGDRQVRRSRVRNHQQESWSAYVLGTARTPFGPRSSVACRPETPSTRDCPLLARVTLAEAVTVLPYPRKRYRGVQRPIAGFRTRRGVLVMSSK